MCCKLNFHIICYCASSRPKHIIFLPQELCGKYYFITASFKSTCFAGFSFAWATFSIMENVFYIKWWVLQQCCSNRMKELCCICCIFSPPVPNISVCLFTPYPVYVVAWTKLHCSLSGNSNIWCIYTYSQHLCLPFSSPILINFSRRKKFPHKLSLLKIFCSWIWSLRCQQTNMALRGAAPSLLPGSRYDSLASNKILILTMFSANFIKMYENSSNFSHNLWEFTRLFIV